MLWWLISMRPVTGSGAKWKDCPADASHFTPPLSPDGCPPALRINATGRSTSREGNPLSCASFPCIGSYDGHLSGEDGVKPNIV